MKSIYILILLAGVVTNHRCHAAAASAPDSIVFEQVDIPKKV